MKAKIKYINNEMFTIIENNLDFIDFCKALFKQKIYLSKSINEEGINLAINTDNIIFVEEIIKGDEY